MRPRSIQHVRGIGLRAVAPDHLSLPDVNLTGRHLGHGVFRHAEYLRQHSRVQPAHPVTKTKCAVLPIQSIVKGKNRVARLGAERLDGMAMSFGKVPEVAGPIIGDLRVTFGVDYCHLAVTGQYVGPFC